MNFSENVSLNNLLMDLSIYFLNNTPALTLKLTLKRRQKNVFTSYFNENKYDGESLLSLSDNVYS